MTIYWLEALRFLDTEVTQETAIATDAASSSEDGRSESLTQQGDKSAKRGGEGLLALLSPPHIRNSESHALRQERRERGNPTRETLVRRPQERGKVLYSKGQTGNPHAPLLCG